MIDIWPYLPGILVAYAAFLVAIISPGPNMLGVMGTSMAVGRRAGVGVALGVAVGSFTWALLTVAGLSAMLATYASALTVIKIVGGVYLLWLAFKAFRSAASANDIQARTLEGVRPGGLRFFRRGYAIQMTHPKAALAWIAIIALGLTEGAPAWVGLAIVLGTFALSVAVYALAFSTPAMVRVYGRARRTIQTLLGTFFVFAGLRLLTSRT